MNADAIREFARRKYVDPAREVGTERVIIRAGDVHKDMHLVHAMPAVCGAIGTQKFQKESRVKLVNRDGPTNGANVHFTFEILP